MTIKDYFPILKRKINGKPLVYLDNAATTQSPMPVIDSIVDFYSNHRANVHRGIHTLSEESTQMYEDSRDTVAKFLKVKKQEIIFVRNTTEACNLVAFSFLPNLLKKGDTIVISEAEHHSNIIPWQISAKNLGLHIEVIPLNKEGVLDLSILNKIDYKFIAINYVSNFLGTINPVKEIVEISHKKGAKVFIDGAQAIAHMHSNLSSLDCDFYAFSGHKIYAPFGIGALYVKPELLENVQPFLTGGGMIEEVYIDRATFLSGVEMFEAGTPNVGGAIALASALDFFKKAENNYHFFDIEDRVIDYLVESLLNDSDITIYGPKEGRLKRMGLVSFNVKNIHSHDLASILDTDGIAIRSGHHCTMPAHIKMQINSSCRASLAMYNDEKDVDALIQGIKKAKKILN